MAKLVWHNIGRREYKPGIDHSLLYIQTAPIEGVVVEKRCREEWTWDDFYAPCELNIDGHTKHRWTDHDTHRGVDVVIEWESYWADELPETEWSCPDCNHLHKGKDEDAENPHYYGNGACKETIVRETWAGMQNTKCYCSRRRPDKENKDA